MKNIYANNYFCYSGLYRLKRSLVQWSETKFDHYLFHIFITNGHWAICRCRPHEHKAAKCWDLTKLNIIEKIIIENPCSFLWNDLTPTTTTKLITLTHFIHLENQMNKRCKKINYLLRNTWNPKGDFLNRDKPN
jgi:hypothetical protein